MKLTHKIQTELIKFVCSHPNDIIIPNFYYSGYEMDVMRINRAGSISEYEIKVSRADFRKDFEKAKTVYNRYSSNWRSTVSVTKHDLLAKKETKVNRFWFVMPEALVKLSEIPAHAGLIFYDPSQNKFEIVKNAPLLARVKVGPTDYEKICRTLAGREISLRAKLSRNKQHLK